MHANQTRNDYGKHNVSIGQIVGTVSLSEKTAFIRRRGSVHEEWSDWKKTQLEDESRGLFDSMEKDLSDYLRMFDDSPFGSVWDSF